MKIIRRTANLINDIFEDRRLLADLSIKDLQKRFSGTFFGMIWGFIQPLITILVYWTVFQFGFKSGDVGETPFALWFITGIINWLYISEAFSMASNSMIEYSYLIQKVKFNVNILPLVKILSSFYMHLFFVAVSVVICILLGCYPNVKIFQLAYYMFSTVIFLFALSLITSSIMIFFRDLAQIVNIILLIGMWGTPIAWNMDIFPENVQEVLKLNPFYYLVEGYRDSILGREWFWEKIPLGVYFWCMTIIVLLIGSIVYTRLKPHFADTV